LRTYAADQAAKNQQIEDILFGQAMPKWITGKASWAKIGFIYLIFSVLLAD